MKKICVLFLAAWLLLTGCVSCSKKAPDAGDPSEPLASIPPFITESESSEAEETAVDVQIDTADLFSDRDLAGTYEAAGAVSVEMHGDSVSTNGDLLWEDGKITVQSAGTYIFSGTWNGMIYVEVSKDEKVQLVLNNVSVSCADSAAIYIKQADKVFVTLPEGTENTLENGGTFAEISEDNIDAVIFSKEDLTLNGMGILKVTSPAGHGIVSKDELTVTGGKYRIEAAAHGMAGKDSAAFCGASVEITAGKDGLHAENNDDPALGYLYIKDGDYRITASGDAVSAASAMQIDGGTFDLLTGGGSENAEEKTSDMSGGMGGVPGGMGGMPGGMGGAPQKPGSHTAGSITLTSAFETADTQTDETVSAKGIKSGSNLLIQGGTYTIDSADDALHSNANVTVTGGDFTIETGDDGLHADAAAKVSGGTLLVKESYEGVEGLTVEISGGKLDLTASDDGINAAGGTDQSGFGGRRGPDMFASDPNTFVTISGGEIRIQASGDGIDSNGALTVSGGYTTVSGPTRGDTAVLDYGEGAEGAITGGTFIGTGAYQMAQSFNTAEQGIIPLNVGTQPAGSEILLTDSDGNEVLSYTPPLEYSIVILSCPGIESGKEYTVRIGEQSGTFTAK